MPAPAMTDEAFAEVWMQCGGRPAAMARETGLSSRSIMARRARLAERGTVLHTADAVPERAGGTPVRGCTPLAMKPAHRLNLDIADGVVIVFSDAHYWPGLISVSHVALLA